MPVTIGIARQRVLQTDSDNDGQPDPGDVFLHTIIITNSGDVNATTVVDTETENGLTIDPASVKIGPIANNDAFNISGNTPITFTAAQLLGNDLDPDGNPATLVISGVSAGTNGTLVDNGNGTYTFTPATGLDIGQTAGFTYSITDAQGLTSVAATPGVVTLTVTDVVWYVDKSYAGANGASDGSYLKPFTSLTELNGVTGDGTTNDDVDSSNETIFIYDRAGSDAPAGIVLETGQKLFGDSHAFVVNGLAVGASTSNSTIDHSGVGITLASGNVIDGIDLNGTATTATGISDGNATVGSLTITNTNITGGGKIIDIDQGGTLAVTLGTLTSTGNTNASSGGVIDLNNVTGTFTVTGAVTINGSQSDTGIDIQAGSFTAAFQGLTTVNTGAQNAVVLNGPSTVSFTGGLDIDTTSGGGLIHALATLNVTGASNSINTATGQIYTTGSGAVAGASGITFATLASSGTVGTTAININNLDGTSFNGGNVTIAGTTGATADGIFIGGGSAASVSFSSATISGTGDEGIEINGASNGAITFTTVTINNTGGNGVELNASTGTVNINGGNIGNTNDPSGDAVNITSSQGSVNIAANLFKSSAGNIVEVSNGNANVTFSGNLSATGGTSNGILLSGNNGGSVTFSGASKVLDTGANAALTFSNTNATGATVAFTNGGLDIDTTTGIGINATSTTVGAGSLAITGTVNTIASISATALNVSNVTIGATNLNFQSISSGNNTAAADPVNGIVLSSTGSTGGLTVTGTGAANSGGTIQNSTGDGIVLSNASNVNLTNILINNTVGNGIIATNLGGANTLTNSTIQNWDTADSATKEGLRIVNNNTNMTSMIVTNTTFDGATDASTATKVGDGLFMEAQGTSNMSLKVQTSTFTHQFDDAIQVNGITGATGTVNVKIINNNQFVNAIGQESPGVGGGGGGISLQPFGDVNLFAQIDGNTFTNIGNNVANTGAIFGTNGLTANADITITNNTIKGLLGTRGITFTADGTSVSKLLIQGNKIDDLGSNHAGISVNILDSANGQITIDNNQLGVNGTVAGKLWTADQLNNAILVQTQNSATANVAITNNLVSANTSSVFEVVRVRAIGDTTDNATPDSTMNVTVTGNTITDSSTTHVEFDATAGNVDGGTINLTITGNTVPGGAVGVITLNKGSANGDLNVTQASAAAVTAANNGATVTVGAGDVIDFGQPAPPTPTLPTLPLSPLLAATPPDTLPVVDDAMPQVVIDDPSGGGAATPPSGDPPADPGAGSTSVVIDDGILSQAELDLLVQAAIQRWADAGASEAQLAAMRAATISVADMTGVYLGTSTPGAILVDSDAAGHGWFIDGTPGEDSEFEGSGSRLTADAGGPAEGHMDLLTMLMHELGHQIGLDDLYMADQASELMYGYAEMGERRLPQADDLAAADPNQAPHGEFLLAPISIGTLPATHAVQVTFTSTVNNFSNQIIPGFNNTSTASGSNFSNVTSSLESLTVDSLTLGNLVFLDNNGNGVFDGGDTGVNGVTISLFADANNDNVADGAAIATTTTAGGGLYSFTSLAPGNYIVSLDAANFSGGGALFGRTGVAGGADPDDNVDSDDNGIAGPGGTIVSQSITLSYNNEPTAGTGNDTNNTVDFGFLDINDAPVNTVPAPQSVNEDATLTFNSGNGNAITVSDPDAGSGLLTVTLSVSHGTLTLGGFVGLSFSNGDGTADATFTFSGTTANINNALSGLVYTPTGNYNGPDTLSITTNDNGNTGSDPGLTDGPNAEQDSDTVAITVNSVNDPPSGQDDSATIVVDGSYVFSAADFNFSDPIEGNAFAAVVIATVATNGGLFFDADGPGGAAPTAVVNGQVITAADLAAGKLTFVADPGESGVPYATFTFRVRDDGGTLNGGNDTDPSPNTFTVNVTTDAAPVLDLNGGAAGIDSAVGYSENAAPVILASGATVTDTDTANLTGGTLAITSGLQAGDLLTINGGTSGTITGISFSYNSGTGVLTLSGSATLADYQAVLRQAGFETTNDTPGASRQIMSTVSDGTVNSAAAMTTVTVAAVNDPPANTVPGTQNAAEDADLTFSSGNANAITVADADVGGGDLTVTLAASYGTLTLGTTAGLGSSSGNGSDTVHLTGTAAAINTALSGLVYHGDPNFSGTDTLTIVTGDNGNSGTGGAQTDTDTVTINVAEVNDGAPTGDTLIGTPGPDTILAGAGNDIVYGLAGDDTLDGEDGNDELRGQNGADTIDGRSGDDDLFGGPGNDVIHGGLDNDTLTGGADDDQLYGDAGNDIVLGSNGSDTMYGGTGDDEMRGQAGVDSVYGDAGNDSLFGGPGADSLHGGDDDDALSGGADDDQLFGENGNDTLQGDLGQDQLTGGAGTDTFAFLRLAESIVAAPDKILDFDTGVDKIDLSAIDANSGQVGDQGFSFIGAGAFSNTAGELRSYNSGAGSWFVEGDVNGDGVADFRIEVITTGGTPADPLSGSDFTL